jgi:hypothetical protein
MRKQLVITDLTRMRGDRVCIFGIDDDGNGIRPDIPPTGIREDYLLDKRGRCIIRPFAVIEFDFTRPLPKPPHTEDWEISAHHRPRLIRNLSEEESRILLEKILDRSIKSIFDADIHNNQYINEGEGNRSLGTVSAKEVLSVRYSLKEDDKYDYRIRFSDDTEEIYDLPITDLAFREYCDSRRVQGEATDVISATLERRLSQSHVFIRVGLARPFARMYNRCYLQVSGVYAFPDYAEYCEGAGIFELPGDIDYKSTVFTLLNDSHGSNRAKAAYLLGETKEPLFVEVLCKATKDPDANVRRLAASALGKIKDPGAIESLTNLLTDARPQVRQYAIKALGDIRDERAVPKLKRLEADPISYLRRAVKVAITKIHHPNK